MPVPTGALKMADARKFKTLAEPISQTPDGIARPMLELKGGWQCCLKMTGWVT